MNEQVTVRRDGAVVDHGRLIARSCDRVLIESDRAGRFAAHPVREYRECPGGETVSFDAGPVAAHRL